MDGGSCSSQQTTIFTTTINKFYQNDTIIKMNFSRQAEARPFPVSSSMDKPGSKPMAPKRRALGDITNAVTDDDKNATQNKKPVIFRSAPEMVVEETKMEVDDRAYMQRVVDDIDGRDFDNPLLVTCYVNEMYDHFNDMERDFKVSSNYMSTQDFVNEKMRSILADWLVRKNDLTVRIISVGNLFVLVFYIFRLKFTSSSKWFLSPCI
jgi:hypothetical protein